MMKVRVGLRVWCRTRASVLVYVLVLIAIVSLVFVGWIELLTARGNLSETFVYAVQRRIAFLNSRAMLHRYLSGTTTSAASGQLTPAVMAQGTNADWGSLEVLAWSKSAASWQNPSLPPNAFNPGGSGAFAPPLQAFFMQRVDVAEEGTSSTIMRPMVGVLRTRTWNELPTPGITVNGSVAKAPEEAPLWYSSTGNGSVSINLADVPSTVIGVTAVQELSLTGDTSPSGFPLTVVLDLQSQNALQTLVCTGMHLRPLTIALRQPPAAPRLTVQFSPASTWLGTFLLQNAPVELVNPETFRGYVLTNSSLLPEATARQISRPHGWNEIYLSPAP